MENSISYLNALLGYISDVMDAPVTRFHYMDDRKPDTLANQKRDRSIFDKRRMTDWQKQALSDVNLNESITKEHLSAKYKISANHAGVTLTALYKANLINRHKIKIGKKWAYAYTGKNKDARPS